MALGVVASREYKAPSINIVRCVHQSAVVSGTLLCHQLTLCPLSCGLHTNSTLAGMVSFEPNGLCLWSDKGSGAKFGDCSLWRIAAPFMPSSPDSGSSLTALFLSTVYTKHLMSSILIFHAGIAVGTFALCQNYLKPTDRVYCLRESVTTKQHEGSRAATDYSSKVSKRYPIYIVIP